MNLKHTNLPRKIQKKINKKFTKIEQVEIKQQSLEIYIQNLMQASDTLTIHKMTSYIDIILCDFKGYDDELGDDILTILSKSQILPYLINLAKKQLTPQLTATIINILTRDCYMEFFLDIIVENGAVQLFFEFLEQKVELIQNIAIQGLGYLVWNNQLPFSLILTSGAFEKIVKVLQEQTKIQENTIEGFYHLLRAIPNTQMKEIKLCFEIIYEKMLNNLNFYRIDAFQLSIEYLAFSHPLLNTQIVNSDLINRLMDLLDQPKNIKYSLGILCCLIFQHELMQPIKTMVGIRKKIVKAGFIQRVPELLLSRNIGIIRVTVEILDYLAQFNAQTRNQILYNEQILNQIFILANSKDEYVVDRVTLTLSSLAESRKNIQFLMEKGLFRIFKILWQRDNYTANAVEIDNTVVKILEQGQTLRENYYLIELKQLNLDRIIKSHLKYLIEETRNRYAPFIGE